MGLQVERTSAAGAVPEESRPGASPTRPDFSNEVLVSQRDENPGPGEEVHVMGSLQYGSHWSHLWRTL